jgi:hypothetical protein
MGCVKRLKAEGRRLKIVQSVALIWVLGFGVTLCQAGPARRAAVFFSDGHVLEGMIRISPSQRFKLTIPQGGSTSTKDITGKAVRYGKVRRFGFDVVKEISFLPEKEDLLRKWRFIEKTKYNEKTGEADYTPAKKELLGRPYPVRHLLAQIHFNSTEVLQGHLYTISVYLEQTDQTTKHVLRSKQRGQEGQGLDDLIYIKRIKLLDEGRVFPAQVSLHFKGIDSQDMEAVSVVTQNGLTPLPGQRSTQADEWSVASTFGEAFWVAVQRADVYQVGWPTTQDKALFELTRDHVQRQRDFYNDKALLGIYWDPEKQELLSLLNLRRRHADTHFGEIGGEWDKTVGGIVEPWRLSIWRWTYNPATRVMMLIGRGTFFRKILLPTDPTPRVELAAQLGRMQRSANSVTIGQETQQ